VAERFGGRAAAVRAAAIGRVSLAIREWKPASREATGNHAWTARTIARMITRSLAEGPSWSTALHPRNVRAPLHYRA